jgi:hypothetical protein
MATETQPYKGYAPGIGTTGKINGEINSDGVTLTLKERFCVRSRGWFLELPTGFVTDFNSTPKFLWRILPPWGDYSPGAAVHDWLYRTNYVSRAEADAVYLDIMIRLGVKRWKRQAIYWGLRACGWWTWNNYRKAETGK